MMEHDKEHKHPLLDRLKSDRYEGALPQAYLDDLAQKSWVEELNDSSATVHTLNTRKYYIGRVAAALLLVLGSYFIIQQFQGSESTAPLFAELSEDELMDYAVDNVDDFNTDLLWESLNLADNTTLIETDDLEILESIDLEDLEIYLLQETL